MRIAQIVTYVSADGAFGGPVAVALAQSAALAAAGHEVEVYAAWDGRAQPEVPGVRLNLFKVRRRSRLTTMVSPRLAATLWLRRRRYDAVHLHFGRDLVSLSAWSVLRGRADALVLQPHGMIGPETRRSVAVLDRLIVRPALQRARAVLALTPKEEHELRAVAAAPIAVTSLGNGIDVPDEVDTARPGQPVALFLARLHPRKNVMVFAEAARRLAATGRDWAFKVIGPDEGDLDRLQRFIEEHGLESSLLYEGVVGPGEGRQRLAEARVYVLPSTGEVYPMTVLESLAVGTPVVLSVDCGLSSELDAAQAARITVPEAESLAAAIEEVLGDEASRRSLAEVGVEYARSNFDISAVTRRLIALYSRP